MAFSRGKSVRKVGRVLAPVGGSNSKLYRPLQWLRMFEVGGHPSRGVVPNTCRHMMISVESSAWRPWKDSQPAMNGLF